MKRYALDLTDDDHKMLKITAAEMEISIRALILAAIGYYLDSLEDLEEND